MVTIAVVTIAVVTIAVVTIAVIVVALLRELGIIHHRAKHISPNSSQATHALAESRFTSGLRIHNEENPVPLGSKNGRIGDQPSGRGIDQDILKLFPHARDKP